jgi:uncharacterized protein YgbK (DUF1537 family)
VQNLSTRPRYIVAKGGSTSSDIATKALAVRRAIVVGQILPGVPVWQLGAERLLSRTDLHRLSWQCGQSKCISNADQSVKIR